MESGQNQERDREQERRQSPYQSPKTNPSNGQREKLRSAEGWTSRKLCIVTLTPMMACLFCGMVMFLSVNAFFLLALLVPLLALIVAVLTAVNSHRSTGGSFLLYLLMWVIVHAALLGLGFVGCSFMVRGVNWLH